MGLSIKQTMNLRTLLILPGDGMLEKMLGGAVTLLMLLLIAAAIAWAIETAPILVFAFFVLALVVVISFLRDRS